MGKKNLEKNIEEVSENWKKLTIISIHDTLESQVGRFERMSYPILKKDEKIAIEVCNGFKERYNQNLSYKFEDGLCYFEILK